MTTQLARLTRTIPTFSGDLRKGALLEVASGPAKNGRWNLRRRGGSNDPQDVKLCDVTLKDFEIVDEPEVMSFDDL